MGNPPGAPVRRNNGKFRGFRFRPGRGGNKVDGLAVGSWESNKRCLGMTVNLSDVMDDRQAARLRVRLHRAAGGMMIMMMMTAGRMMMKTKRST